jgi:hypothetical protein
MSIAADGAVCPATWSSPGATYRKIPNSKITLPIGPKNGNNLCNPQIIEERYKLDQNTDSRAQLLGPPPKDIS